jgi:hypothetical protein
VKLLGLGVRRNLLVDNFKTLTFKGQQAEADTVALASTRTRGANHGVWNPRVTPG